MTRDANGLIPGFPYVKIDGRINWKAHIGSQWLRVKDDKIKEVETRYTKKIKDIDLSTLEDYYLYVKLGGYNEVARLRGYDSLLQSVDYVDGQKAVVTCTMHFIPNTEDPNGLTCAGVASGSIYNIKPEFAAFMETFAENRAFSRCVRRALNINIVAEEELGKGVAMPTAEPVATTSEEADSTKAYGYLSKLCREKGMTLDNLKTRSAGIKGLLTSDPVTWTDWKDIPKPDIWTLVEKVKTT
jgi:hypothetical protein